MQVRAVTPQVAAHRRGLQFYRDADWHDLERDHAWEEVDPSGFYPDERLETMKRRPSRASRTSGV